MNELIARVIQHYYPDWDPPADYRVWNKCRCPFHGDTTPSAALSYDLSGFNCFACGVRGDEISIIRHEEGVDFAEAVRIAASLSVGSDYEVPRKPPRKPSRRVFGEPGDRDSGGKPVRPGLRERAAAWARDV